MKNNNVDIKSLIIGFLMATCMMMAFGANSKPDRVEVFGELDVSLRTDYPYSLDVEIIDQ